MSDSHGRLITLPKELWADLDADAKRCRRSSQKQIEAILTVYYRLANVDLKELGNARNLVSPDLARESGRLRKVR